MIVRAAHLLIAVSTWLSCESRASADQLTDLVEQAGLQIIAEGQSDSELHKQTRGQLPLQLLSAENRRRAEAVLNDCSQYRRLPALRYSIDEPIYRYLVQHPDVAVSTWRAMGISRFEMLQTGPMEYEAKAVDGSEGIADILYQDASQTLFICEGQYHNVLLPRPLKAAALIWFRADYTPHTDGCHLVQQHVDVFASFPSAGVSAVAKMLTPVTNSMMDRNLYGISLYASMMSRAVRDEPDWVIQVARQLDGVLPQRPNELIAIARLPRGNKAAARNSANPRAALPSIDHSRIQSPRLLFFDPPKVPGEKQPLIRPASSAGSLLIIPAMQTRVPDENSANVSQPAPETLSSPAVAASKTSGTKSESESGSGAITQPSEVSSKQTVPPAGPTASGPVGSRTGTLPQ